MPKAMTSYGDDWKLRMPFKHRNQKTRGVAYINRPVNLERACYGPTIHFA